MRACTFFGHRECPEEMREVLLETIAELVRKEKVEMFYVGNQGRFDQLVLSALRTLKSRGIFHPSNMRWCWPIIPTGSQLMRNSGRRKPCCRRGRNWSIQGLPSKGGTGG